MNRYLRLAITEIDAESSRPKGVFGPSYVLLKSGSLPAEHYEQLQSVLLWFERHLPLPDRSRLDPRSIFWFKTRAELLLQRIWPMVRILACHGRHIELVKTNRPGYVVYGDDLQLAAIPFADTFCFARGR
jgi:hypothetical protein